MKRNKTRNGLATKTLLLALCVLALMALTVACGENTNLLIGEWECRDTTQPHDWMCWFTFTDDGRFIDRDRDRGSWSINGNNLLLNWDDYPAIELTFTVTRSLLTLQHGNDLYVRLNRVSN